MFRNMYRISKESWKAEAEIIPRTEKGNFKALGKALAIELPGYHWKADEEKITCSVFGKNLIELQSQAEEAQKNFSEKLQEIVKLYDKLLVIKRAGILSGL